MSDETVLKIILQEEGQTSPSGKIPKSDFTLSEIPKSDFALDEIPTPSLKRLTYEPEKLPIPTDQELEPSPSRELAPIDQELEPSPSQELAPIDQGLVPIDQEPIGSIGQSTLPQVVNDPIVDVEFQRVTPKDKEERKTEEEFPDLDEITDILKGIHEHTSHIDEEEPKVEEGGIGDKEPPPPPPPVTPITPPPPPPDKDSSLASTLSGFGRQGLAAIGPSIGATVGSVTGSATAGGVAGAVAGTATAAVASGPPGLIIGGMVLAAIGATQALKSLTLQTQRVAESISELSPDVAVAEAMNELKQLVARMERAGEIGEDLGEFTRIQGDISVHLMNIRTSISRLSVPAITTALNRIDDVLTVISETTETVSKGIDVLVKNTGWIAVAALKFQYPKITAALTALSDIAEYFKDKADDEIGIPADAFLQEGGFFNPSEPGVINPAYERVNTPRG